MSSSEQAVIDVASRHGLVTFTLVDSGFQTVAHGNGRLRAEVPAGIYELVVTAGAFRRTEIVVLRQDTPHVVDDLLVEIETTTPADGPVAEAASRCSRMLSSTAGPDESGVVVVAHPAGDPGDITLTTAELAPFGAPGEAVVSALRCKAGGHVLRLRWNGDDVDIPMWLPAGWQVVVFAAGSSDGCDPAATVIHLVPITEQWQPDHDRDAVLELLLAALQKQGSPLPDDIVERYWRWAWRSPDAMIPLLSAVLAHRTGHPSRTYMLDRAADLLPDHPDVLALKGEPLSWPPTVAASYWTAVLPNDHRVRNSIVAGSRLDELALGLSTQGAYLTMPDDASDTSQVAADRVRAYLDAVADLQLQPPDHTTVAKATGLPLRAATAALNALQPVNDEHAFTVPGDLVVPFRGYTHRLRCDYDPWTELATLRVVDWGTKLDSLLLSGPGSYWHLLDMHDGTATWKAHEFAEYALHLPRMWHVGTKVAYEAVSLDREAIPTFSSEKRVIRQRTSFADGHARMDLFETAERTLELAVQSDNRDDAGHWALISVHQGENEPEELAVPLTWLTAQGAAAGALRLGRQLESLRVFLVPRLVTASEVGVDLVRRSCGRFADQATERALLRALEKLSGGER